MAADLSIELLRPEAWLAAMELSARAFFDEPYVVEMYGREPLARYAGIHDRYAAKRPEAADVTIAVYAGTALVGAATCSPPGQCSVCDVRRVGEKPADAVAALDWEFEENVRAAHSAQAEHGWVNRVAVEPGLRGLGIGRLLVSAAVDELRGRGASTILLECQGHRVAFYEAAGFAAVTTFPDPAGPDAHLMRSVA